MENNLNIQYVKQALAFKSKLFWCLFMVGLLLIFKKKMIIYCFKESENGV